jgi:arginase family enzyme
MHQDREWLRASDWIGSRPTDEVSSLFPANVGILGVPCNASISPGNCHLAPSAVREALAYFSPFDVRTQTDLTVLNVVDFGDLPLDPEWTPYERDRAICETVKWALTQTEVLILLGGDNALTRPAVNALGDSYGGLQNVALVTLDAHLDMRTLETGPINGNPISGLLSDGLMGEQVAQVGIQSFANSVVYWCEARKAGICEITAEQVHSRGMETCLRSAINTCLGNRPALYADFDVDVLDRAFAPACPGARPGGINPQMALTAARMLGTEKRLRVIDFVEVDPTKDVNKITSLTVASLVLNFITGVAQRRSAPLDFT